MLGMPWGSAYLRLISACVVVVVAYGGPEVIVQTEEQEALESN